MKRDFDIPAHLVEPKSLASAYEMMDDMGRYCDPRPGHLASGMFPERLALAGPETEAEPAFS